MDFALRKMCPGSKRVWLTVFAAAVMLAAAAGLSALEPTTPLSRFGRQVWSMENGLPQNTVPVLMQGQSGFLWAGTELGLARFDGVGFRVFDHATAGFPDAEIRCLLDVANFNGSDELWVGTGDGLVRWKDARAALFTVKDGLPGNSIRGLVQASDGKVWVWTESGLALWDGQHFVKVGAESGSPRGVVNSIAANSSGGVWIGTTAGAALFRQGGWQAQNGAGVGLARVTRTAGGDVLISAGNGVFEDRGGALTQVVSRALLPADGVSFLSRLADGTIAAASKSAAVLVKAGKVLAQYAVSKQLPGSRIEAMFADREGSLWVGTNRGLARFTGNVSEGKGVTALQLLPLTDPLVANAVVAFLEDREGDLWVGTESGGLHVLRDARFRNVGVSDGLSSDATTAVVQDVQGGLWIGTRDAGLNRLLNENTKTFTTANGLLSDVILALAAGPSGDVWVGTPDGLSHISEGSKVTSFTSADGLPDDFIRSLLAEPDGSVWIGTRRGLTHLEKGRFINYTKADGLGSDLIGALAEAGRNRTGSGGVGSDLWIATLNGLSRLSGGRLRNFTTADGLSSNVITALEVTSDGQLWVGTQSDGLNLLQGERFVPLGPSAGGAELPKAIRAILADDLGHIWLASDNGLIRTDTEGLLDCSQGKVCRPGIVRFTTADGLRSRETSSSSHPTALRARNGELWFTTPRGAAVVDPLHVAASTGLTPVAIERFAVDDAEVVPEPAGNTRIAAGHLRFQFDYAGLNFASPQKVRYAYMLQGFDHTWTDAGTRRTAYYTNIPPGTYCFLVRASLGYGGIAATHDEVPKGVARQKAGPISEQTCYRASDGNTEATLAFELLPHYYQTWWFRGLVVGALALVVLLLFWVVIRRRVLGVEREFGAVMGERSRIAREIHDTLAQGYVGISLQLEILGQLLHHGRTDAAAKHLAFTQGQVREGLEDARQSIWALRSQDSGEQTLPIRLRRVVERAADGELKAELEVHGAYRPLAADTEKEILRITQEAIQNVKRHAEASSLRMRLEYDERFVVVSVADNGKGFDAGTEATTGHYGLTGMRERAALIQGDIGIVSTPGNGTTVTLKVLARNRTNPPGVEAVDSRD